MDHNASTKKTARAGERGITLASTPPCVGAGPKSNTGLGVGPGSGMGAGQGAPSGVGKGPGR